NSALILQSSTIPSTVLRGFLLPHTKESLSSTESIMDASHLGFPQETLTSAAINVHSRESLGDMAGEGCVHL
ncbi:hypothetical protein LEMLEM_LOCUS24113, partial [Lemmus lemmus]